VHEDYFIFIYTLTGEEIKTIMGKMNP